MVLVSVYVEHVKLHHVWKPQPHAIVYHLYTTLCSSVFIYKPQCSAFDLYLKFSTCNNIILSDIHREVMRVRILSCTVKGRSG